MNAATKLTQEDASPKDSGWAQSHCVIVSPGEGRELMQLVQEALPAERVLNCKNAQAALRESGQLKLAGHSVSMFVLDFRGLPATELALQIQHFRREDARTYLVVVVDRQDSASLMASLQVELSPERLTFLTSPLSRRHAADTLSSLAEVARIEATAARVIRDKENQIRNLQLKNNEQQAQLERTAHDIRHDGLTGALNRTGFVEELTQRLSRNHQDQIILMVDLDRFKAVNDTLGHFAGDELIKKICSNISAIIPPGAVLARLGGDEFGILIEATSQIGVQEICVKVQKTCNRCRIIAGHEVQVTASIGVASQSGGFGELELMRQADLALHAAKRTGRNQIRVFDAELDKSRQHRLSIESGIERGLVSGQFYLAYQPIVSVHNRQLVNFEALVRWNRPDYGEVMPSEFIPIAEETGLILDLGDWIARQALKDCRRWNFPGVSINLSVRQFLRHNVGERLLRYAADADVDPSRIQIELTETAIIDDVDRAAYILRGLRDAGVRVALDDFGTGYSSLVYLNQFALDCIKIDKSFVDNITRDRQSAMIVASVSKLAISLGLQVIAEGVETEDQSRVLLACGCELQQGYFFGKPTNARDLSAYIEDGVP
jgi:diguanylate cyclase (GGDEF)-like protein